MSKRENFFLPGRELRIQPNADGSRSIVGLIPYNSPSAGLPWTETIAPGAFRGALQAGADVLMLRDHNPSLLLGRTLASTLALADSSDGLQFRCTLPNTTTATDLIESMSRKDITGVSFGFVAEDDEWSSDSAGNLKRILRAVNLQEISVCSFAAYPDAKVAVRSIPKDLRALLKRSKSEVEAEAEAEDDDEQDECSCDCPECLAGDCADCSNPDCDDPNCVSQAQDDEDRSQRLSWSERTLLRLDVARRN